MVAPDFSEFTFGYAVTRHIEDMLGGRVAVPNHPTQAQEAVLGYDVDFLAHGVPILIQYKRSSVMKRRDCTEFSSFFGAWFEEHRPFFRMHLHRNNGYQQHMALWFFEHIVGVQARYCTSSVVNKQELDTYYQAGDIFGACTFIRPSSILLPDVTHHHFVSFHPDLPFRVIFSEHGTPFRNEGGSFGGLRAEKEENSADVIMRMRDATKTLDELGPQSVFRSARRRMYEERVTNTAGKEIMKELAADFRAYGSLDDYFLGDFADELSSEYLPTPSRDMLEYQPDFSTETDKLGSDSFGGSVIKRLAYEAYRWADAYLVSIPRDRLG